MKKMPSIHLALPVIAALFVSGNVGSAAALTYNGYSVVNNQGVTITRTSPYYTEYGGSGQIVLHNINNTLNDLRVWCLDVFHTLQGSGTFNTGSLPLTGSGTPNPPLTQLQIDEISSLVYHGNLLIGNSFGLSGSAANISSAIQVAIWTIEYGTGWTFAGAAGVNALATTYIGNLGNIWNQSYGITLLTPSPYGGNQDLAFVTTNTGQTSSTPLPSTWLMLLSGFIGLGFFAYRGTKKNSAAFAAA